MPFTPVFEDGCARLRPGYRPEDGDKICFEADIFCSLEISRVRRNSQGTSLSGPEIDISSEVKGYVELLVSLRYATSLSGRRHGGFGSGRPSRTSCISYGGGLGKVMLNPRAPRACLLPRYLARLDQMNSSKSARAPERPAKTRLALTAQGLHVAAQSVGPAICSLHSTLRGLARVCCPDCSLVYGPNSTETSNVLDLARLRNPNLGNISTCDLNQVLATS